MDEKRFSRLENRVDEIKDEVTQIKVDASETKAQVSVLKDLGRETRDDLREYLLEVKNHVQGDEKIINEIQPLLNVLPSLTDMIKSYEYKQTHKKEKIEKLKYYSMKMGLISLVIGILVGLSKLANYFS